MASGFALAGDGDFRLLTHPLQKAEAEAEKF
jgi:hypothetical protein